jgi:hypothetical protein
MALLAEAIAERECIALTITSKSAQPVPQSPVAPLEYSIMMPMRSQAWRDGDVRHDAGSLSVAGRASELAKAEKIDADLDTQNA